MNQVQGAGAAPAAIPVTRRVTFAGLGRALLRPPTLMVLWLAVLASALGLFEELHLRVDRPEFSIYYLSSVAARRGLDPYAVDLERLGAEFGPRADNIERAIDPPSFILLFMPLTALSPERAYWAWIALNTVMLATALLLLLGPGSGLGWRLGWALAIAAILYPPIAHHFFFSQGRIPILLLLAAAMRLMEWRSDIGAGAALAAASVLGGFPFLMLGYLLLFRRWRVAWSMMIFSLLAVALTIPMFGMDNCLTFVRGFDQRLTHQWLERPTNISVCAFVSRLFRDLDGGVSSVAEIGRAAVSIALQLGVLAVTVYASLRLWAAGHDDPYWSGFALWIVAADLLRLTTGVSDLVTLLILFAALARAAVAGHASRRTIWTAVASYLLIGLVCPDCPLTPGTQLLLWRLLPYLGESQVLALAGAAFFALALGYLSCYWLVLDQSRESAGQDADAIAQA